MNIPKAIHQSWIPIIGHLFEDSRMDEIAKKLQLRPYSPEAKNIFRCFSMPFEEVNVVICGLSPYYYKQHGEFTATGIAMGVKDRTFDTPTLKIIREALAFQMRDITIEDTFDWTLESWVSQGVLMMNRALTVDLKTSANSQPDPQGHFAMWDWFTSGVVKSLSTFKKDVIFAFLGDDAAMLIRHVDNLMCPHILKACHPAATARVWGEKDIPEKMNFVKHDIFININKLLVDTGRSEIKWY